MCAEIFKQIFILGTVKNIKKERKLGKEWQTAESISA